MGELFSFNNRYHLILLNTRLKPRGISAGQSPILMFLSRRDGMIRETFARFFTLTR
ncbi:MAG: hypothetical protein A4E37_01622 [Methanoregulaceae archaeon PtaB.Bin056]|nr:MAG: hypothetical protein A4E37_01622 [Methanoregulaceae archaeon PtaB.Bin056]